LHDRATRIRRLREEVTPDGRAAALLDAMFDRARRFPEYARDLSAWVDEGSWLTLRRAAAPFGDFGSSRIFAGSLYELDAAMSQTTPLPERDTPDTAPSDTDARTAEGLFPADALRGR